MKSDLYNLLDSRKDQLYFYSPYTFLREYSPADIYAETVRKPLLESLDANEMEVEAILFMGNTHYFIARKLTWDTEFFGFSIHKLAAIAFDHDDYRLLTRAIRAYLDDFFSLEKRTIFFEIPSEENMLIQALGDCGFRMVETRINTYIDSTPCLEDNQHKVRKARPSDIPNLRHVAEEMANPFDRVHSDISFSTEQANSYLARYAEESVKGFADLVIVPDDGANPPDGFISFSSPIRIFEKNIAKILVMAISKITRKGWGKVVISEGTKALREMGADYVIASTQASNKATIANLFKLGFKLGSVTHTFSKSNFVAAGL